MRDNSEQYMDVTESISGMHGDDIEKMIIDDEEQEMFIPPANYKQETTYNTVPLTILARMCDRFGTSSNEGAALANAVNAVQLV